MTREPALAKISRPRLRNVCLRTRLFDLLDKTKSRPVVWITGTPGSGKTTLLASYLDHHQPSHLWYQFDETDADVGTFLHYFTIAAKRAAPRRRQLPKFKPEYLPQITKFARRFFREFYSRLKPPALLAFDNYQDVPESPFHALFATALEEIPEGVRVVVLSRAELPVSLARLRAEQAIELIGSQQLKLTPHEADAVTRLHYDKSGGKTLARELHRLTDGWVAGMVLILEYLRASSLPEIGLPVAAAEAVFSYFAGEILERSGEEERHVLLKTSLLPDVTAHAAKELTGLPLAGRVLVELNSRQFFTDRVSDVSMTYRYHPLFHAFLRERVETTYPVTELTALRKRAAELLLAEGRSDEAAELLLNAGDAAAAPIIIEQAPKLLREGRHHTVASWIERLPPDVVERDPWVLYWRGACRLSLDLHAARGDLERAFALFDKENEVTGTFLAWAGIVDTYIFSWADYSPLDHWIAEFERLRAQHGLPSAESIAAAVSVSMFCALLWREPQHPELSDWAARVEALIQQPLDLDQRVMAASQLCHYYVWWDYRAKMNAIVDLVSPLVSRPGTSALAQITWRTTEAFIHWSSAEFDEALRAVEFGLRLADETGVHFLDSYLYAMGAYATLTSRELDETKRYLERMAAVLDPSRPLDLGQYHYLKSHELRFRGDLAPALVHAQQSLELLLRGGVPRFEAAARFTVAQMHLLLKNYDQAAEELVQVKRLSLGEPRLFQGSLLAEAELAFARNERAKGLDALRKGLALAREKSVLHHDWWDYPTLFRFFQIALEEDIESDYVRDLIRRRQYLPQNPPLHLEQWPWRIRVYTLGQFSVMRDDAPIDFLSKAQRKRLAMLKVLVALGGHGIGEEQLSEVLWPDAEGHMAHQDFATTLHRLRKLLGYEYAVVLRDKLVSLDPRYCWVDTWAFEWLVDQTEASGSALNGSAVALAEKALAIYKGPFLGDDVSYPPFMVSRERLRSKFHRLVLLLAQHWAQGGQWQEAAACYERSLDVEPFAEQSYRELMRCYVQLQRGAEAIAVYRRCQETLRAALGTTPGQETTAVYEHIRAQYEN